MNRWYQWSRCGAALVLLAACSDSHGDGEEGAGLGPKNSTETGNPPVIDLGRIALAMERDQLHLVGQPRAVMPGSAELEVERLATGDVQSGRAERDGSFDLVVDGTLADSYRLRARTRGVTQASKAAYVDSAGATAQPAELCADCALPDVSWGRVGPTLGTAHRLTECTQYLAIHTVGEQCASQLPCTSSGGERTATAVELESLLGDPELQQVLARGETIFGPSRGSGFGVGITIGERSIRIHDDPCDGLIGCEEPPASVRALRELLAAIADQQACREICADQPERTFVAEACLECSSAGGCLSRGPICATPCTRNADCADEGGACSPDGACDPVACE